MPFIWLIFVLQIVGPVKLVDSSEDESTESDESDEIDDYSTTTRPNDSVTGQTHLMAPFQFPETKTQLNETKVNALSVLLKNTVHRIRQQYKKIDVVFLLDASSSVGKSSFLSELKFVRKFLSDFNVSYNYTRVSLVTFSSQGKIVSLKRV